MANSKDDILEPSRSNRQLPELPPALAAELERTVAPEVLCGQDDDFDRLLDEVARDREDLGMRLHSRLANFFDACNFTGDDDPLKAFAMFARYSYAASRLLAESKDQESHWVQARNWHAYGLRKVGELSGNDAEARRLLERAVKVLEENIRTYPKGAPSECLANAQEGRASSLFHLAMRARSSGDALDLLKRGIEACEEALRFRDKQDTPQEWMALHEVLAKALLNLSGAVDVKDARDVLARASKAQEEALGLMDRKSDLEIWIGAQIRLGTIRNEQAEIDDSGKSRSFYVSAGYAFKAALRGMSREDDPERWALAQANLGSALVEQAKLSPKGSAAAINARAAEAIDNAMEVLNRKDHPKEFAKFNVRLGEALLMSGRASKGKKARGQLERALEAFNSAEQGAPFKDSPALRLSSLVGVSNACSELTKYCPEDQLDDLNLRSIECGEEALKILDELDEYNAKEVKFIIKKLLGKNYTELALRSRDEREGEELFDKALGILEDLAQQDDHKERDQAAGIKAKIEEFRKIFKEGGNLLES